ncbi:MAG TPA: NAD(P)-binding oxidoreductase [Acidothermaceae bacterium]|nr:NAD(P)-binding oxidoreductase [Acidothermaceae bacterium]
MRIAVFGSTGGTGAYVIREAIARGHDVTAFARRPEALAEMTGLAEVVQGDARDVDAASKAIAGQDVVIVTVSGRGQPDVVRDVSRAVTVAMGSLGVSRLVATSAYGLVATRPLVLAGLVRRIFAKPFSDQLAADHVIQATDLTWTIARATRLTSAKGMTPPRISTELFRTGPYSLGRARWADVLLDLAQDGGFERHIVNVTG